MKIRYIFGCVALLLGMTSCTDYLDREPDSVISATDAYKNFRNFQGFVEELYSLSPDVMKHNWVSSFNWGDDEVITLGAGNYLFGNAVDNGNYRSHINKGDCFLYRGANNDGVDSHNPDIWNSHWYGIRKANMGLQALEQGLMTDASQDERDVIKGQLLFYRAWFYFNLTCYWGGMPYMTEPLSGSEVFDLPRESYQENADKMIADFKAAAALLPIDWDQTEIGRRTQGNNALRPNKISALSYAGKAALYAASPLMEQGINGQPYQYNKQYAEEGAEILGEVLKMVEGGETQFELMDFENYSDLFYTTQQNWLMPGGTEAIMRTPTFGADSYWRQSNSYQISPIAEGDGIVLLPAANYVNYFGMANGLPLSESEDPLNPDYSKSGFNPNQPWKDRDPRFYYNFVYDGVRVIAGDPKDYGIYSFAHLFEGGNYRDDPQTKSRTGYLLYKFIGIDFNRADYKHDSWAYTVHLHLTWMRLAEVYLMYAECLAAAGTPTATAGGFSKNAIEAVNTVRARAGVDGVHADYQSGTKFLKEVYRERAVELAFEGHRFNDLRRWLLLTQYPYNIKTEQLFDRAGVDKTDLIANQTKYDDPDADPKEAEVVNFREQIIITRNLGAQHYWLPLNIDDVSMYPEFYQNPGW